MENEEKKITISGGIGLPTILTLIFVVLKLNGTIDWSLWWVFSPLWISGGFILGLMLLFVIFYIIIKVLS